MKKNINFFIFFFVIGSLFYSCDKEEDGLCCADIVSDDGIQARLSYTDKGYIEIEITPIIKNSCYFSDYNKEILTPVSGLFEYYDTDSNCVSIDFGDGTCDEWATKTWDIDVFPDYPSGEEDFSIIKIKYRSKILFSFF